MKNKKEKDEISKVFLYDVPEHKKFHCVDGTNFRNLEELQIALKNMNDQTFKYHANSSKNDFTSWIYDCIGDLTLAKSLVRTLDRKKAATKVRARITKIKKSIKE